jgi:Ca2+/Na+ antiporter
MGTIVCTWISSIITIMVGGYYYVKAFKSWKTRIQRHKIFLGFSTFFIICLEICVFTAANDPYNLSGPGICLSLMISNVYVYVLVWIYSYNGSSRDEIELSKKIEENSKKSKQNYMYLEESGKEEEEYELEMRNMERQNGTDKN